MLNEVAAGRGVEWRDWILRHRMALLLGVVLVYAAGFSLEWRISPDSAANAVVARHLARGGEFAGATELGIDAMKLQPGLPWLMAGTMRLFDERTLWPLNIPMWLTALGGLAILYRLLRWHFEAAVAAIIVTLAAINLTYYEAGLRLLTEMPFTFGLLVMLLGYEWFRQFNDWRMIAGIGLIIGGIGLMALFRSVALVAVAALMLSLLWQSVRGPQRRRAAWMLVAALALLALQRAADPRLATPWVLNPDEQRVFTLLTTRLDYVARSVMGSTHLPKLIDEAISETLLGVELDPFSGVLLAVLILIGLVRLFRVRPLWGLIVCGFIVQVVVFRAALARYFVPIVPLLAVVWWLSVCHLRARLPDGAGKVVGASMLVLWIGCNLARIADLAWEQRQAQPLAHYRDGRYPVLKLFADELRAEVASARQPLILEHDAATPELRWYADMPMRSAASYLRESGPSLPHDRPVYLITRTRDGVERIATRLERAAAGPVIEQPYPKYGPWLVYQLMEPP
ncbi:MAG: ArnT family glycosyltransferase [Phycisphaeraceae bacterium]